MKYVATFEVSDPKDLYECLQVEAQKRDRSEVIIENSDPLKIIMKARDASALRATTNSIIKLLTVSEKVENV